MEHSSRPGGQERNEPSQSKDVMSVIELQKFLADELASTDSETSFARAFVPITEGLGLESPKRTSPYETKKVVVPGKSAPPESHRPVSGKSKSDEGRVAGKSPEVLEMGRVASVLRASESDPEENLGPIFSGIPREPGTPSLGDPLSRRSQDFSFSNDSGDFGVGPSASQSAKEPVASSAKVLGESIGRKEIAPRKGLPLLESEEMPPIDPLIASPQVPKMVEPPLEPQVETPVSTPPPLPVASGFRRMLAGLVDQILVFCLWLVTVLITSHFFSHGTEWGAMDAMVNRFVQDFSNTTFVRYAGLAFFAVWFCYLSLTVGMLGMTVGMWVWGVRVNYGAQNRFWKKFARCVVSWLLVAPLVTTLLLAIRVRGKNLIDAMSGTSLYRTAN